MVRLSDGRIDDMSRAARESTAEAILNALCAATEVARIEDDIRGRPADERRAMRQENSRAIVADLGSLLREKLGLTSQKPKLAEAIRYTLSRWRGLTRFLNDGRIEIDSNTVERSIRPIALGRKSWLFAGSERGAERAAAMTTLIMKAKLNDVDPLAWLADVLARIADTPHSRLHELLPWEWNSGPRLMASAA